MSNPHDLKAGSPLENANLLGGRFRAYLQLARPYTLLAPFNGGLSGALMALGYGHEFWRLNRDYTMLLVAVAVLMLLNAASNALNQVVDVEMDRISKSYRPLPRGLLSARQATIFSLLAYALALAMSLAVNPVFAALVALIALISLMYNCEPVRFKRRFILGNLSIGFSRGYLGILAAYTIYGSPLDPPPHLVGALLGIYVSGWITSKDIPDLEADKQFGCRTLPAVLGVNRSVKVSTPFMSIPYLLTPLLVYLGLLPHYGLVTLPLIPLSLYLSWLFSKAPTARTPVRGLAFSRVENTVAWSFGYLLLAAAQALFGLTYIAYGLS